VKHAKEMQGVRAGFVSRTLANGLDAVVVLALELALLLLIAVVRFLFTRLFKLPMLGPTLNVIVYWVIAIIYMTYGWSSTGKTFGKQLVGLRAVSQDGEPLSGSRAFLRALLYAIFLPGFALVLVSRKNLSLQDHLVGSNVVYDWRYRGLGV
jgi:uncharacterized RDD family membrane protein YckC